jgi:Arc/MetJ-type ribon-helix-helix transcriptional regulator
MTATVKLPAKLEMQLRQHCASSGQSISEVIRTALEAHLPIAGAADSTSPWALGQSYFGKHSGDAKLAETYRNERDALWSGVALDKAKRRSKP